MVISSFASIGDIEALCKSECRDAIDDTEVSGLGLSALGRCHLACALVEEAGSGGRVNILARVKCLDKCLIATQVCHQAQLYLRVVGSNERMFLIGSNKGGTNRLAQVIADRYILQVRVGR